MNPQQPEPQSGALPLNYAHQAVLNVTRVCTRRLQNEMYFEGKECFCQYLFISTLAASTLDVLRGQGPPHLDTCEAAEMKQTVVFQGIGRPVRWVVNVSINTCEEGDASLVRDLRIKG